MARKPNGKLEFVNFNVTYEDGSVTSNRRVPAPLLDSLDGEAAIIAELQAQDAAIAERSGRPRGSIKEITRVKSR